ncbi:TetR/AcrR family transcriptional regulator [Spongiibacter marinus]|uniref:TetR/AcrR family transcriptional regulator n=1 Tax=Spongiibacter marinus TaxID=354246 RepID=UPI00356993DB
MARPRTQPNAPSTRSKILNAARIEFSTQGIAAPLDAIAKRCGIRRPSLLHHFPSKQALIAAVTDDILGKARERLIQAVGAKGGDYVQTMQAIIRVLRDLEAEEQGVAGVLLHALMSSDTDNPVSGKMTEFIDIIFATVLMAGNPSGKPKVELRAAIAHLVMGELTRVALASSADAIWGEGDGVDQLFRSYFLP